MKTELEIAKENIKWFKKNDEDDIQRGNCLNHKATCQRFLDKYDREDTNILLIKLKESGDKILHIFAIQLLDDIIDNRNAIKLYNEAGI